MSLCNRVHLHIVCAVALSCLYVSVSSFFFFWMWGIITSFICNNSFTYVLRIIILDISETAQEKGRGNYNGLWHVPSKQKEEIKSETSGCGSFLLPTSNLILPSTTYLLLASLISESQQCAVHVRLIEWKGLPPPVTPSPLLGLHFRKAARNSDCRSRTCMLWTIPTHMLCGRWS